MLYTVQVNGAGFCKKLCSNQRVSAKVAEL